MAVLPRSNKWLLGWWVVWGCIFAQQMALHSWRGSWFEGNPSFSRATYLVVIAPLGLSMILRWLVWPKIRAVTWSFAAFLSGLILAGMSALSATFLDVPYKQVTFLLCLAGILVFLPIRRTTTA